MELDLKKVFWIIVGVALIAAFTTYAVNPAMSKVRGTQSQIESVGYTAPTTTTP